MMRVLSRKIEGSAPVDKWIRISYFTAGYAPDSANLCASKKGLRQPTFVGDEVLN